MSTQAADVLVTGAAGKTGQAVLRTLVRHGSAARALVRQPEQVAAAESTGAAQVVVGDLLDPAALSAAMQGMRAIYLICPNMHPRETEMGQAAILAAQAAGVQHFVYHSVLLPAEPAMPHHWQKHLVEQALQTSGLSFSILQPASYMQNILPYWETIQGGVYRVPYSVQAVFSPVDLEDVAEAAAVVLSQPGQAGRRLQLAGPELLSSEQMATEMANHLGRPVRAAAQPLAEWAVAARQAGLSGYARDTLQKMFVYYDLHGFGSRSTDLQRILDRRPRSFRQFLSQL